MNVLAMDTSGNACSVALQYVDLSGKERLLSRHTIAPRQQTKVILKTIHDLIEAAGLSYADLSYLAYSQGPGSFTGLRLTAAVIKALSLAYKIPVIPVSTLAAMAQAAYVNNRKNCIIVALDARQDHVFLGCYYRQDELMVAVNPDQRVSMATLVTIANQQRGEWVAIGDGWCANETIKRTSLPTVETHTYKTAEAVLQLAMARHAVRQAIKAEEVTLNYLY